jgi:hypothetical protein
VLVTTGVYAGERSVESGVFPTLGAPASGFFAE